MLATHAGLHVVENYMTALHKNHCVDSIYRGHADKSWAVEPSASRENAKGITSLVELQRWRELSGRFIDRNMSNIEMLVLAQHYGVRTMLLDWTTNPLIALYFACIPHRGLGVKSGVDGAVIMQRQSDLMPENINPVFDPFTVWDGDPMLIKAHAMNQRTRAQDSIMTLHCTGNTKLNDHGQSIMFSVADDDKEPVLLALSLFGISNERVYADINTAARDFQERLERATPTGE